MWLHSNYMQKLSHTFEFYGMVEKEAADGGNSARLYVPKKWQGKKVIALLLEPIEPEKCKKCGAEMIKAGKGLKNGSKYQRYQCPECGHITVSDEPYEPIPE